MNSKPDKLVNSPLGAASLIKQSAQGGSQKLTISSNVAQGANQSCRSVLVVTDGNNVFMTIGRTATEDDFILPKNVVIPVPIDNCSDLYFYGGDGTTIRLLWRN